MSEGGYDVVQEAGQVAAAREKTIASENFPGRNLLRLIDDLQKRNNPNKVKKVALLRKHNPEREEQLKAIREGVLAGDFSGLVDIEPEISSRIRGEIASAKFERRGDSSSSAELISLSRAAELAGYLDLGIRQKLEESDDKVKSELPPPEYKKWVESAATRLGWNMKTVESYGDAQRRSPDFSWRELFKIHPKGRQAMEEYRNYHRSRDENKP